MPYENKDAHAISLLSQETAGKPIIYLTEDRKYGYLLSLGAHMSRVLFVEDGIEIDTYVENDEYILIEEEPFIYERE